MTATIKHPEVDRDASALRPSEAPMKSEAGSKLRADDRLSSVREDCRFEAGYALKLLLEPGFYAAITIALLLLATMTAIKFWLAFKAAVVRRCHR